MRWRGIIMGMNSIVRDYLAHALENTSRLAERLSLNSLTPAVAMWEENRYLVVASCDNYQQHEFRLMMFYDDNSPTLLGERVLAFSPMAAAAAARALNDKLDKTDSLHIDYDGDKTIMLVAQGITICLKATESKHRDNIRKLALSFAEEIRSETIKINAKEFLTMLPKPRRNNDRMYMLVHFFENTWQVGIQPDLDSWKPTEHNGVFDAEDVQGKPNLKLNVPRLREALEAAERYHPFAECAIETTNQNEPVLIRVNVGKALYFKAYIMPVVEIQR